MYCTSTSTVILHVAAVLNAMRQEAEICRGRCGALCKRHIWLSSGRTIKSIRSYRCQGVKQQAEPCFNRSTSSVCLLPNTAADQIIRSMYPSHMNIPISLISVNTYRCMEYGYI